MTKTIFCALFAGLGLGAVAASDPEGWEPPRPEPLTFTADRIIGSGVSKAAMATGHVHAVAAPMSLHGHCLRRFDDGTIIFSDPTFATTCTNMPGLIHWRATGEIEYRADDYVILRNMWVRLFEIPILWLPYMYYPLDTDCGFSWMPGYCGRWGAYLLTKYQYHLFGDVAHRDFTRWLRGATRFDLRYRQGVAVGEDLKWNLGDFGAGEFRVYYAWDEDAEDRYGQSPGGSNWNFDGWGSQVDRDRYILNLEHALEPTEKDRLWMRMNYYSDTYASIDFFRRRTAGPESEREKFESSGLFWDHVESAYAFGGEVSGRLNEFYEAVGRLPEFYLDVNPQPLFGLPVNYESQNRFGYLTRNYAEYGSNNIYSYNPGPWAEYDTFRGDTYHRLTAPFRTAGDTLSVVPRVGYHGTFWAQSGRTDLTGASAAENAGQAFRSILEGGVTFAGRGVAWVNDRWSHMVEPYLDVLAQQAWLSGIDRTSRAYVFDNIDASLTWEDQFAGRGRNLPYSYYGVTPGLRNVWSRLDEGGSLNQVLDFDVYAAVNFGETDYLGLTDDRRLAEPGCPNYGKRPVYVSPGARLRWAPVEDVLLTARAEYDTDRDTVALADVRWAHRLSPDFSYYVNYGVRDFRYWDFSSMPYSAAYLREDVYNLLDMQYAVVGCTHHVVDWFQWSPFVRWDVRDGEVDCVGGWFDFLTDCLGFRFQVRYQNEYMMTSGYLREDDLSVDFIIYLRAFGAESADVFGG